MYDALVAKTDAFSKKWAKASIGAQCRADSDILVLSVAGYIDSVNSADFGEIATLALSIAASRGKLQFDLSSLDYISSTGVGVLTSLVPKALANSVEIRITGASQSVVRVFDVLGFRSYFVFL